MNYNLRFLLYTVVAIFWTFSGKAVEPHSAYSEKTFQITSDFILVPIENWGPVYEVTLVRDNMALTPPLKIGISRSKVDYWVPIRVGEYKGLMLTLRANSEVESGIGWDKIYQSDTFEMEYYEKYRPLYHFSPLCGWMNDPNGLVYHNGEYHLFYQHNPYGTLWGNMHWGHAVTSDFIKWEHFEPAIDPDSLGVIYSGSAVIDKTNTTGFGEDAMMAVFTYCNPDLDNLQTQALAYSTDAGRTFTKYDGNPVLRKDPAADFRDPNVMWYDPAGCWIMALATGQTISFYTSDDLKQWHKLSEFGEGIGAHDGVWECPDLIEMETPDGRTKWVLLVSINPGGPNGGSATQYFIGNFDGRYFTPDPLPYPLWLDYGRDNYAGVTWDNVSDDRQIFIGWMSNWDYGYSVPGENFRHAMTIPRELFLKDNGKHLVVASRPAAEMKNARKKYSTYPKVKVENGIRSIEFLPEEFNTGAYSLSFDIIPRGSDKFGFTLSNKMGEELSFDFDMIKGMFSVNRTRSGLTSFADKFSGVSHAPIVKRRSYDVEIYIDKASCEVFVDGGLVVQTNTIFPTLPYGILTCYADSGNAVLEKIIVFDI